MEGFTGNVTGKSLIFWDAPSKRIIGQHIGSSGMTWRAVLHKKKGRKWTWKFLSGGLADGRKVKATVHWTFSEDGDELHLSGKGFVGKDELDPLDDHYHRVSD